MFELKNKETGWRIGYSSMGFPVAHYKCSVCRCETSFEFSGSGVFVEKPDAECCAARQPYPQTAEFVAHLQNQRKYLNPEIDGKRVFAGGLRDGLAWAGGEQDDPNVQFL
jgi:hypothetical protein